MFRLFCSVVIPTPLDESEFHDIADETLEELIDCLGRLEEEIEDLDMELTVSNGAFTLSSLFLQQQLRTKLTCLYFFLFLSLPLPFPFLPPPYLSRLLSVSLSYFLPFYYAFCMSFSKES